jgi:predicted translin family RNA/ssDNA-binding protein
MTPETRKKLQGLYDTWGKLSKTLLMRHFKVSWKEAERMIKVFEAI